MVEMTIPPLPAVEVEPAEPGIGSPHVPFVHFAPPGQTTPSHGSLHAPAWHFCPAGQVTLEHFMSRQRPSSPQVRPPAQPRHLQSETHRPRSQTRLAGQVTPAQGSTQRPS